MFLIFFFYPRMNKQNIHNNIGISSFENGFNHPFSSTGFYFKRKITEGHHVFKISGSFFQNMHFWCYDFFSRLVLIQSTLVICIYKIHVFDEVFFVLTIKCPWFQTCQFGDILLEAPTHKFPWHLNGLFFEVTWQIK